jgi:uncharacterized membrane protein
MDWLWLIVIGLGAWVWRQSRRISALLERVNALELRVEAARVAASAVSASTGASETAPVSATYVPEAAAFDEPLLLDTPIPDVSNDQVAASPASESEPLLLTEIVTSPAPVAADAPLLLTETAPPQVTPKKRDRKFEQWLAENGFAWAGAGAFALAGIYLVSYATQQNWFTPGIRLICAVVLGLALLAASEWARRQARNKLVAALLAGAGAATFYATAWATHGLYHYVDAPAAAALLTLCAAILLGLSLMHGEALGILAIVAAFFAPPLTSMNMWPPLAITLYVLGVGIAGYALSYLRRWSWAGVATLAGLYFWFAAAIGFNELGRALALISLASLGGVALSLRPALPEESTSSLRWSQARQFAPSVAICISSVLMLWAWIAVTAADATPIAGPALIAVFHVALAAYAVRTRVAASATIAVAIGALVVGFAIYLSTSAHLLVASIDAYPTLLFAAFTVTASALGARAHRTTRALVAGAGSVGAGLLTLLAATTRADWHSVQAWAPLFAGSALLFAAAWRASRDIAEPSKDNAVDFWAGGAAVLALIGAESGFPAVARVVDDAVLSLGFAAAFARFNWRALRLAALAAAAISIAHALSSEFVDATLQGALPLWRALLYLAAAAAALFAGSGAIARRAPNGPTEETLSSASLITLLIGVFLLLRWVAVGGAGAHLDDFSETALRVFALVTAGHIALPRPGQTTGAIVRWRGHALMSLGLLYGFLALGLTENPWWGGAPAHIEGPPLFNGLLLGFAAPATLALAAANRLYGSDKILARVYAATGGVFMVLWAALELRRAFHPTAMASASVGVFEAACYGVLALAFALLVAAIPRVRALTEARPFTRDLQRSASAIAWAAMIFAVLMLLVSRHPWWGAQEAYASDSLSTGLGVVAQAWAATLSLGLGRALSRGRGVDATRFAAAACAAMFALSFGHSAIRWIYHGGGMDEHAPFVQLEGFAHSLWPLVFILAASAITTRAPGRESVRPYLFDLEAIWSVAIWPAMLFAALGLWSFFNPWWGGATVLTSTTLPLALAAYPIAAVLTFYARHVPHPFFDRLLKPAVTVLVLGHLMVGLTLLVRSTFHGANLALAPTSDLEMWSYSAAWALFGGCAFAIGTWRNDHVLWWAGVAILAITGLKVFFFDTARLSGIIRALSLFGFGVVATLVAVGSNYFRRQLHGPDPMSFGTGPRRDRRLIRRQRS